MPVSVRRFRLFSVSIGQAFLWALLLSLALLLIAPPVGDAQVVTNITPTTSAPLDLGTNVDTFGSTTEITGGTRPGSGTKLFHSFDAFSLGTGDTAHFLNDMQLPTTNIFGRVIGGEVSTIDGTLRTNNPLNAADPMNFGSANLWLVNPSGLFLGPNARIEVGGSVSMSTADYLRFEGTAALFDMLASPASLGSLSVAPVAAFGFLGSQPAPITLAGSILQGLEGQALSLVGGDITIQSGTLGDGTIQSASFRAPGVPLNLVSVSSPGEVLVSSFQTGPNVNGASFTTMGAVMIKEGVGLDVSGQLDEFGNPIGNGNSGTVLVRAGKLVMDDGSTMLANTVGAVPGASKAVDIQVSHDVALANGSAILTLTSGPGRAGDVQITAGNLTMEAGALILTGTLEGDGDGGDVVLNVGTLNLVGGARIETGSPSFTSGIGRGGNVTIAAAESVTLSGGSGLLSTTAGLGDGGRVAIFSPSLTMNGAGTTVNTSVADAGRGGDIVLGVQQASLSGGATIITQTSSADPNASTGGTVTLQALGSVLLSGQNTGIISGSEASVPGDLTVHAGTLTVTNGAVLAAGSSTSAGPGGVVTVTADSIGISAGGQIFSRSFVQGSGQVAITANQLNLDNGSIDTSTSSESGGRGGNVMINGGTVSLTNGASITSQSEGVFSAGPAGDITMTVGSLTLANQSIITSSSNSVVANAGDAGTITIQSGSTVVMNNSSITAETIQSGGGQIRIAAPEMVRLINSRISTSVAGSVGDTSSGKITFNAPVVLLQNSAIISQAIAGGGAVIDTTAGVVLLDANSIIGSSSGSSVIARQLTPLPQQFTSAAALLLAERCAADSTGQFSSFVQTGREGVPQIPGALSPSPLSFLEALTSSSLGSQSPNWAAARLGLDSVSNPSLFRFPSACRS